jgi:hypothetical protein
VGLTPLGKTAVRGVSGLSYHNLFLFRVGFVFGNLAQQSDVQLQSLHVFEPAIQGAELALGESSFDVLLGMDIVGRGSLKIDGDGSFSFSF